MNGALLKGKMREHGLTQKEVAEKIGVSLSRFNAKLNETGGAEFSLGEVRAMIPILRLTPDLVDDIFFNEKVS